MKRFVWILLAALGLCALLGCRETAVIQNTDDGKLRIDADHVVDFYLGNDEVGAEPIEAQCMEIIGNREPDVKMDLCDVAFHGPEDYFAIYRANGTEITIVHYWNTAGEQTSLYEIALDEHHALASGIRIGSTEDELRRAYDNEPGFRLDEHMNDDETRWYVLYGDWYERYPILFEVDASEGLITGIYYELDI